MRDRVSVEEQIIKVLGHGGEFSMPQLVKKLRAKDSSVKPAAIKAAVLPLISSERVSLTVDLKLLLREQK